MTLDMGGRGYATHPGHFVEVCREHGTMLRQCRCPGPKVKQVVPCPGGPPCPPPAPMRVRACWGEGGPDGGLYVHLGDLMCYLGHPDHDVSDDTRSAVASLLQRLGEALESE